MSDSKAVLILADGQVFEGTSLGAEGVTLGEVVFTTGMTGYIETLTDPSYYGQIVTQTFPLIGNYGVISKDFESNKSWVKGYIVRELCDEPSNFRCEEKLDDYLKSNKRFNLLSMAIIYLVLGIIELTKYGIIIYCVYLISNNLMEVGTIVLIYTYFDKIITNFEVLGTISAEYQSFVVSLKRLNKLGDS